MWLKLGHQQFCNLGSHSDLLNLKKWIKKERKFEIIVLSHFQKSSVTCNLYDNELYHSQCFNTFLSFIYFLLGSIRQSSQEVHYICKQGNWERGKFLLRLRGIFSEYPTSSLHTILVPRWPWTYRHSWNPKKFLINFLLINHVLCLRTKLPYLLKKKKWRFK